jgi:DNA-binding transcriptional MerR regulator
LEGQASIAEEVAIMRIGEAAKLSGVSAKLIRYYEGARLLSPAGRDANGYRIFDARNVHELCFIRRARSLGFPIKEIDQLLNLWRDKQRPSRKVRALSEQHKQSVVNRMNAHRSIVRVLAEGKLGGCSRHYMRSRRLSDVEQDQYQGDQNPRSY